jgi:hypothetical protein
MQKFMQLSDTVKATNFEPHVSFGLFFSSEGIAIITTRPTEK